MKDYSTFDPIDFAQDDSFLRYVKYPGQFPEIDNFWNSWLKKNSEKIDAVEEAKQMIHAVLQENMESVTDIKQREIWVRLQQSMAEQKPKGRIFYWNSISKIAATILLLLGVASALWWFSKDGLFTEQSIAIDQTHEVMKEINEGVNPKTVVLADGSSVVLQPNSTLEYPRVFDKDLREVRLKGEAFFEVAKNRDKPFIVYADKLVTKVLGTSFIIRALEDNSDVLVQVKTGKVSVFTKSDLEANKNKSKTQLEGLILIPNQQVVFSRDDDKMVKSLIENPSLLNTSVKTKFIFHDTPLIKVFSILEQSYGVKIIYDEDAISRCSINASLDDMPLYDKMRLICKGIDANYEVLDSHIIFTTKGCK